MRNPDHTWPPTQVDAAYNTFRRHYVDYARDPLLKDQYIAFDGERRLEDIVAVTHSAAMRMCLGRGYVIFHVNGSPDVEGTIA